MMSSDVYLKATGDLQTKTFVARARKIAHIMSASYNQKKNAYEAATTTYNKKGTLDIGRIHSYKVSDDIFKRNKVINGGGSHGIVCALDFSVSMRDILVPVAQQFLINALFCKYAKIEFQFFTFTTSYSGGNSPKKKFKISNNNSYARYVNIGNSSMSESALIEEFYDIMIFHALMTSREVKDKIPPYQKTRISNKFNDMNSTPLVPALYQSYLLAKMFQDRGVQNVSILVINDGDNNCNFDVNGDVNSITDPYSKRVYSVLQNGSSDSIICAINRMSRDNGISVLNIFLGNRMLNKNLSDSKLASALKGYIRTHDGQKLNTSNSIMEKYIADMVNHKIIQINNLCYYNKVIFVDDSIFPKAGINSIINSKNRKNEDDRTAEQIIEGHSKDIKVITVLGKIISDFLVTDFKYTK